MHRIGGEIKKDFYSKTLIEWIMWMVCSLLLIIFIKWFILQYGAPEYDFHVWVSATLYLWYVSTISLLISSTYFISRNAQSYIERRQNHPQKPQEIDLSNDLTRVKRIKKRAAIVAICAHLLNAVIVYFATAHIPGITAEYQMYAVIGVFAIAAIKPATLAVNSIRAEIFGMIEEADYPQQSVADLWRVVNEFTDYETRLTETFEHIDEAQQKNEGSIQAAEKELQEKLHEFKAVLNVEFGEQADKFISSDKLRECAYQELKTAQIPLTKEVGKILTEIQNLQSFVIELRDKNIKGEQLMSALKEFGIDSLADLNVSFQKSVVERNPH